MGFFIFGDCDIYKLEHACIYTQATKKRVSKGEYLLGSGFPIGASSIPVGTRLSPGKSCVLYLCGADGSWNCSTPRKVWLQLRRSGGKGCPLRGSISGRKKAGRRCGQALSVSRVICGTKVYQSARQPLLLIYQNHHAASRVGCLSLLIQLFCPARTQVEMKYRADRRVFDAIGKAIAVQKIGLPPDGWHPASPARGPKRTGWTPVASNQ